MSPYGQVTPIPWCILPQTGKTRRYVDDLCPHTMISTGRMASAWVCLWRTRILSLLCSSPPVSTAFPTQEVTMTFSLILPNTRTAWPAVWKSVSCLLHGFKMDLSGKQSYDPETVFALLVLSTFMVSFCSGPIETMTCRPGEHAHIYHCISKLAPCSSFPSLRAHWH